MDFSFTRPVRLALLTSVALAALTGVAAAQQSVTRDVPANAEPDSPEIANDEGFVFSIDGVPLNSDARVEDTVRKVDLALSRADIQVRVDGLELKPRLGIEVAGPPRSYAAGDVVILRSETNYPAFVARAEMRLIDRGANGGPRLLAVVPVEANGSASVRMPVGTDVVAVHRVYDAKGRYDETFAVPLGRPDDRGLTAAQDGQDDVRIRNIPLRGGSVTVSAANMAPGARLSALGISSKANEQGRAVIERILPSGDYPVAVEIAGGPSLTRDVTIDGAEWFVFGLADVTIAEADGGTETYGRVRFYIDGETDKGVRVTASLDTGEEDLDQILRRLDEKDPRSIIEALEDDQGFLTFGDDSTLVDNTPTSGKLYFRIERDKNFLLWGDYQARLDGSGYLRNERTLYGAQASWSSAATTDDGEPRTRLDVYAAQPDRLPGRDVFEGTGGSLYFLQRQAISVGSETVTVEIRDAVTGRVISRRTLVEGRDYDVNYLQGTVTLSSPLSSQTSGNLIETRPGGDQTVNLVVQYEFTPTAADVDGFALGGRIETWASEELRFGITAMRDETGAGDLTTAGVDLRYEFGDNSFVQLDLAQSDGQGPGTSFSTDGGLITDNLATASGDGTAIKIVGQADFADIGWTGTGVIGGYAERRSQGFSTLDYSVTEDTGDEELYGLYVRRDGGTGTDYAFYFDRYENEAGTERTEVGAELGGALSDRIRYRVAAEYLDEETTTTSGDRVDVAARLAFAPRDGITYGVFGQTTVASDGLDERSRLGVDMVRAFDNGWTIEGEVSGGTGGLGARALASYADADNNSRYFGYELDPGRALNAGISRSENGGKYIFGGRRQVGSDLTLYGENVYDLFGTERSLTSAYGAEYAHSDFITYDLGFDIGSVSDSENGDFDRYAVSLGMRFEDAQLTARTRLEYRQERASNGSTREDADTIVILSDGRYLIDDDRRLVFSISAADTDTDESSILDGTLVDAKIGYAVRPVTNERLNILADYRFLYDMYGQEVDGVVGSGPVQRSHVFQIQANYDLTPRWTVGGKLGVRLSESGADSDAALSENDAWLAILNARYDVTDKWDVLLEARHFDARTAGLAETSALTSVHRQVGQNAEIGVGYNFGSFSDDLTDLTYDDGGLFLNLIAKF